MQMGSKIKNGREERVAGTFWCQSAVESPHIGERGGSTVGIAPGFLKKQNYKNFKKIVQLKAPGFREVVCSKLLWKKTSNRFPDLWK